MKIFSLDVEVADGLYGDQHFAIAAVVRQRGKAVATFEGRTPVPDTTIPWVRENVIPALDRAGMTITHDTVSALRDSFWAFWMAHKEGALPLAHMHTPVETGLFRACVLADVEARQWDGPYPYIADVAQELARQGHNPASVDSYISTTGGPAPEIVGLEPHHPLFDAYQAAVAWERLSGVTPLPDYYLREKEFIRRGEKEAANQPSWARDPLYLARRGNWA